MSQKCNPPESPVILIPANDPFFRNAANEFVSLYRGMTGIKPAICTRPSGKRDMIVLGSDSVNPFVHRKIMDEALAPLNIKTGTDDYRICSITEKGRNILFIAGGRNRAVLYGIYHFFELLGCRYFWDGDRIPQVTEIPLAPWDITEKPRFDYRGLRYFAHRSLKRFQAKHWDFAEWRKEIDWCLKKRFNLFMLRTGLDDIFQKAFPDQVSYPPLHSDKKAHARSYTDLAPDWSLQYRGKLRKKILDYAFERDLMHPEDIGTMTHWYSPTPEEFLQNRKPDFLPQSVGNSEKIHLVWDIRQEKFLNDYMHLTDTHIEHYGKPELFHTIGLAERRCFSDLRKNHEMKLYTYRRLIYKLRQKYPDAPLLIASWDFAMHWSAEEIKAFLAEMDPENTIILEYTAETGNMEHNFTTWDITGKFPWIFGIFHAYEANSDIRGDYSIISSRLATAADDPMCKGMVFWPENSHSDTLMLEYAAANSWSPSPENRDILSFIKKFVCNRYLPEDHSSMLKIWESFLPVLQMRSFVGPGQQHFFSYMELEFQLLNIFDRPQDNIKLFSSDFLNGTRESFKAIPEVFALLAEKFSPDADDFIKRDVIDIARSCAGRLLLYTMLLLGTEYIAWCDGKENAERIRALIRNGKKIYSCFAAILGASEEFSLWFSLEDFRKKHPCNRELETSLKGNAENSYCRSWQFELLTAVYSGEFEIISRTIEENLLSGTRELLDSSKGMGSSIKAVTDEFYAAPLHKYAPDVRKNSESLQQKLYEVSEIAGEIRKHV